MKANFIFEKLNTLNTMFHPEWIDGDPKIGGPGPTLRAGLGDYAVAEVLRDIGNSLKNTEAQTTIRTIAKELAVEATQSMAAGFEDGDDICPPFRFPRPHFLTNELVSTTEGRAISLNHVTPVMNDLLLSVAIRQLASLTTSAKASVAMTQVGENIVKSASSKLFDDYCGTVVKVRVPGPRPKATTAAA